MEFRYQKEVIIPLEEVGLKGYLTIPQKAKAIIIFAHGSGSSRLSRRNQEVAAYLQRQNFGTLLFDLLTEEEDQIDANRFNIELLTERLGYVTEWLEKQPACKNCRLGYFGASTGAASALIASTYLPQIAAVVSRGGRPDMAMEFLKEVTAPTLLIVGSLDDEVIILNERAYQQMECDKELKIVSGASHLFEEPGKMHEVSELAFNWFEKYLTTVNA